MAKHEKRLPIQGLPNTEESTQKMMIMITNNQLTIVPSWGSSSFSFLSFEVHKRKKKSKRDYWRLWQSSLSIVAFIVVEFLILCGLAKEPKKQILMFSKPGTKGLWLAESKLLFWFVEG